MTAISVQKTFFLLMVRVAMPLPEPGMDIDYAHEGVFFRECAPDQGLLLHGLAGIKNTLHFDP